MNMQKKVMLVILFIIILSNCNIETEKTTDVTQTPGNSPTLQSTLTAIPSTLVVSPTYTSSPSLVPTASLITPTATTDPIEGLADYQRQCLPVTESSISKVSFPGRILIYRPDYYQYIDLNEHQAKNLVTGNIYIGKVDDVSPDRRKLIASAYGEWDLMILESNGTILKKIKYQDQWMFISWLDNERWLIQLRQPGNSFIVYDPIREQTVYSFAIDAPEAYSIDSPPGQNMTITQVDPTATLAIYFERENGGRAVLWNIQARKILAWLPIYVPPTYSEEDFYASYLPLLSDKNWSSDGIQFVLAAPASDMTSMRSPSDSEELFSITRTGDIHQLTHFNDVFDYVHIEMIKWSPDGHQLAFLLQTAPSYVEKRDGPYRLIVYDTQSLILKDFCLGFYFEPMMDLIWSPSGKQLIVQARHPTTHVRTVYVLDLAGGTVVKFPYDPLVDDWLLVEP